MGLTAEMKKLKIRYIIIVAALLVLAFNEGSRTVTRRFFEQRKLKSDIKSAQYQNELLKKRIYYLEHEPSYIERMVRSELSVIAPGEVEYRFHTKETEPKVKEKENEKQSS
jgi:cell division protein FtsB